ncbi:hypothetical protein AF335_03440 [Streptomyces eurocidicus]|uniref:Uncharacterized protein n=1 Tax=Streptomyces eurocidicus TaxID=66423 RepID=A0A2N8P317_STREU|nr:hypothetical protein [Streptomyces eurocidicus]MBB5117577.1 hypothetical protein [Streptomyces eurocidicus]MBF6053417.1 hypothetical protein [Streptomyces eurocidicus]PNE35404.1 hypothetical protein AF335_03440 [Streptomyces eurocidicus]
MIRDTVTSNRTHRYVRVQVDRETVRTGDVIDVGGRGLTVVGMIDMADETKGLRFRTGQSLTMDPTTRLSALRAVERR